MSKCTFAAIWCLKFAGFVVSLLVPGPSIQFELSLTIKNWKNCEQIIEKQVPLWIARKPDEINNSFAIASGLLKLN